MMFAGRVIKKNGIVEINQPRQFFEELSTLYKTLDNVPLKAVEDLAKYELNRDIIIDIMRRCIEIIDAAGLDLLDEWDRIEADPFDGLEEDFEKRKKLMRVSGEEQN